MLASHAISGLRRLRETARSLRAPQNGRAAPAPPQMDRYDSWLDTFWGGELDRIDAACVGAGPEALGLFRGVDSGVWAALDSGI